MQHHADHHLSSILDTQVDYFSGLYDESLISQSVVEYGTGAAKITGIRIEDMLGRRRNTLLTGFRYKYRFEAEFFEDSKNVSFGMMLRDAKALHIAGATNEARAEGSYKAGHRVAVMMEFNCVLLTGTYFTNARILGGPERQQLCRVLDALMFKVEQPVASLDVGLVSLGADLHVQPID